MKDELTTLTAFARQLDELIQEIEKNWSADRPVFLQHANDFINRAFRKVTNGELPPDYLVDLLEIQEQLAAEVERLKQATAVPGNAPVEKPH